MRLKSLRLLNFRQFRGNTKIEFSSDSQKNVTVILGNNTSGKSTLLQAFSWCLYEKTNFVHNKNFLLNYELATEMKNGDYKNVEVELELVHGGNEYTITRGQTYRSINGVASLQPVKNLTEKKFSTIQILRKNKEGETETIRAQLIGETINNILPEHLSSYFFFDTERVNTISSRKDVVQAVKGLLGLSIIANAVKHLGGRATSESTIKYFFDRMDRDSDDKANALQKEMNDIEEDCAQIKNQIEECNTQILNYEERREEINKILRDNERTAQLQKEKDKFEQKLLDEKQGLTQNIDNFFKDFNNSSLLFFSQPLLKKVTKILKQTKIDKPEVLDFSRVTMQKILKRGYCICGRKFQNGDEVYQHLEKELSVVPQESIDNAVLRYLEKIDTLSKVSAQIYERLENSYREILRKKKEMRDIGDEIELIAQHIAGKENMKHYSEELATIRQRITDIQNKKDRLNQEVGSKKNDSDRLKKEYEKQLATVETNKENLVFVNYAEKISQILYKELGQQENKIREKLESKVDEIFKKMYSGDRRVSIDEEYNVHLLAKVSNVEIESGESEGSNRVKNFAFIAGLVALAKDKISIDNVKFENETTTFDLSEEPYPLVMDAPFSNSDETHTSNIAQFLPEFAEQVVMFVMYKDWKYAAPVLREKIGKQYHLNKINETLTEIIEIKEPGGKLCSTQTTQFAANTQNF